LIAFQNDNQDELFKYYDNRNKTRLNKLKSKASITKDQTHELKELGSTVLSILKKIANVGEANGLKSGKENVIQIDRDDVRKI